MKAVEGRAGRVFVIRLEDRDVLPDCLERFAAEKNIECAQVILIGGVGSGDVVVGPRDSAAMPPDPMTVPVDGAHEVCGVGVIAPDETGKPILHIHAALGRGGRAFAGCLRKRVKTWLVAEAIIYEILGARLRRRKDPRTGFTLLEPES